MLEQGNHVAKERDKMSKIDDAEKLDYIIKRYKDLKTINNKELIDDIFEKYLGHFIEESDAYIKEINSFTNKEQFKINIYAYIYSLFICNHIAEKINDVFVEESLNTIFSILLEANKNIKAEREISKGYKYVIDKYAIDKLQNTQWHKYPEDKPKCESGYVVIFDNNGYLEAKHCQWIKGMFSGIKNILVKAWIEMPYVIEGKGL